MRGGGDRRGIVSPRGSGRSVRNPIGSSIEYKARAQDTGGSLNAFETVAVPPGDGPPFHVHPDQDEALYILEGTFRFRLEDDVHTAPAGSFVFVPRGVHHTWQNAGETSGRLLFLFAPAAQAMETFFERFSEVDPGAAASSFAELAALGGMEVVGPPLARADSADVQ